MNLTMKDVMTANCKIAHTETMTSNHCAALARELNKLLADALAAQRDEGLAREAELQKEVERIRGLPHGQILAEAAAKHLLDSGAENFVGEVFTIDADDGQTSFEIVVTTQKVGAKSPGEVCKELQQLLAEATDLLKHMTSSYHRALENGYDRIIFLGGDCDSVAKMEADDPYYAKARAFLASPGCADGEKAE